MTDELRYTIEARALPVAGVAAHNFWVLRDQEGRVVSELHGLATDRETMRDVPIGTNEDRYSLRAWQFISRPESGLRTEGNGVRGEGYSYCGSEQPSQVVLAGSRDAVLERWNAAVSAIPTINAQDRNYPSFGVRIFGATVNSNSMYGTFGEIMQAPTVNFPGRIEPGINNRTLEPDQIRQFQNPLREGRAIRLEDWAPPDPLRGRIQRAPAAIEPRSEALVKGGTLAQSLHVLAREKGLQRVDHVVIGNAGPNGPSVGLVHALALGAPTAELRQRMPG